MFLPWLFFLVDITTVDIFSVDVFTKAPDTGSLLPPIGQCGQCINYLGPDFQKILGQT